MTQITSTVDFAASGKQIGWLRVPHSVTRSAYGVIPIPVAVLNNGNGPRILLTGGTHGDEYEPQVVLTRLVQHMQAEDIRGRLIIIPALNTPAAIAGGRVSPLDDGNLNRAFPGDPDGAPTWKIADYVQNHLVPMVDVVGDFHCGGSSLAYRPHASTHFSPDSAPEVKARSLAAVQALGLRHVMVFETASTSGGMSTATRRHGKIYLNGEYGGTGSLTQEGIALVDGAVRRLLAFFGATDTRFDPLPPPQIMHVFGPRAYVYAPDAGVFVPAARLGAVVAEGALCGELLFPENPGRAPIPLHFEAAGEVVCQRHPARVERGDCLAHLARPAA
ncbi:MAG: succinylglutamate desuccinylase/aspartoacylase family protein [Acetobacteraceae bacterium]|nr:succinylglutamate desuccinylase/aspartoacylase family protein [Acetobacteraceae bacterium]